MEYDLILAGGGLANGLIALRLAKTRPELRVAIVEAADRLGGNHIWSSFDTDLRSAQRAWTARLYAKQWRGYAVRFPKYRRLLGTGYASVTGERLDHEVRAVVPAGRLHLGQPIVAITPTAVTLGDQTTLRARAVIDGRGAAASPHLDLRWQKFIGQEVELAEPHGLTGPIIMDATVPQHDGYRFVYTLPFSPTRVLIEDTYFSDGSEMSPALLRRHIADYAAAQGWTIVSTGREEQGILPLALGGDIAAFWDEGEPGVGRVGLRAGLFNPVTGYSFPDAVRTADLVAGLPDFAAANVYNALRADSIAAWQSRRLYRMLNRMLFLAAHDEERRHILQRFYRLNDALVSRFYAARSTLTDWARILSGKPPIPISRALRTLIAYEMDHR